MPKEKLSSTTEELNRRPIEEALQKIGYWKQGDINRNGPASVDSSSSVP